MTTVSDPEADKKKPQVGAKEFVQAFIAAWKAEMTNTQFAESLGITKESASRRASGYRAAGIVLPKLKKAGVGRAKMDVDGLNAMIQEAGYEGDDGEDDDEEGDPE